MFLFVFFYKDGNLPLVLWKKPSSNIKPDQQIALRGDHQIEEISTNDLLDERTFNLNSKLSKLFQMLAPHYNHGTNTKNLFSTGNTNPMSVSMNSNQQTSGNRIRIEIKIKYIYSSFIYER